MKYLFALFAFFLIASCAKNSSQPTPSNEGVDSIIGGSAAVETDAVTASTVALVSGNNEILKENCTGTLISENLVLTASHCLDGHRPSNIYIQFGPLLPKPYYLNQMTAVKDFIAHQREEYSGDDGFTETELNDVAVILLKTPAPKGFKPVPIASAKKSLSVGQKLLLAGYGHTNDRVTMRAKGLNYARVVISQLWESLIVLDQTNGQGACNGDSGGPAYVETNNGLIVVGITRGAHDRSPHCHNHTEYTNASFFKNFILQSAAELEGQAPTFVDLP